MAQHRSLAVELLKAEDKGVVAAFSPTGLSLNEPAHRFHELLLDALLRQGHARLGDAVLSAQSACAEIVKAVRQNILFGAKVIKIMVDAKPYGYTVEEMKLFVNEAAKAGLKVEGHIQTREGARRAIEAGLWSLAHSRVLDDELHEIMAEKGIWRAGTETPFTEYRGSAEAFERTVAGLKNAYENGVNLTFSTDADYYVPGMTRGEIVIDFLKTWKAAGIPAPEVLKAMTINGYKCSETMDERGPIKPGLAADIIAVSGNPMEDIDALREVEFVMKDGTVFKKDGVMTPEAFFHGGPVKGWRIR